MRLQVKVKLGQIVIYACVGNAEDQRRGLVLVTGTKIVKYFVIIYLCRYKLNMYNCNSRRGNTKASGRETAEAAMEGVVDGDGMAEGSDNLNLIPSTSSSSSAPDMATSSSTTSNTNPSSSGTQASGGGVT